LGDLLLTSAVQSKREEPSWVSAIVEGIERAIFGEVTADDVTEWLDRHMHRRLSLGMQTVLFRAGRLAAVYGLQLTNGSEIVAKVYRRADVERLVAAISCQQLLADAGYPCPLPLDGPVEIDGRIITLEFLLQEGERGDAHQAATRQAMARSLAQQLTILRSVPLLRSPLLKPPGWAHYENGPWPVPHDPIFDFTATPVGFEWLDAIAKLASQALSPRRPPDVIGHCDWACQNLRFDKDGVCAAYDWDSLLAESEPVLVGVAAGAYTEGSSAGAQAPTPGDVVAFLSDYEATRHAPFSKFDQAAATAAATWVLAYNARCGLNAESFGYPAQEGSALKTLLRYGVSYLTLRW
jgi:Phosphotransferase enzyme family